MTLANSRLYQIILVLACSFLVVSCGNKNDRLEDTIEQTKTYLQGEGDSIFYEGSGDNGFQMFVYLFQNNTARVLSGCPQYSGSQLIDGTADVEYLTWSKTADGFILEDPSAGRLYSAVIRQGQNWDDHTGMPYGVTISWSHSAGACWETNAAEKGWKREVNLSMWINLWGDEL